MCQRGETVKVITQMTIWVPIRPWAKEHLNRLHMTALQPCVRNPYATEFYGKSKTAERKCCYIRPLSLTWYIISIQTVLKFAFMG